jgi:hypothetical protein
MGYTYDTWTAGGGLKAGTTGGIPIASSQGALYQQGTAITATATEINYLTGFYAIEAGTTSAAFTNYGVTSIPATTTPTAYTITAPVAGVRKIIYTISTSSSGPFTVAGATNTILFGATNQISLTGPCQTISLLGLSSTQWQVLSKSTN